jgi:hypothetical protein
LLTSATISRNGIKQLLERDFTIAEMRFEMLSMLARNLQEVAHISLGYGKAAV